MKRYSFQSSGHPAGAEGGVEWFVLDGARASDSEWLETSSDLDESVRERLWKMPSQNLRAHPDQGTVLCLVRTVSADDERLVGFNLFVQPRRIVTVCHGCAPLVESTLSRLEGLGSAAGVSRLIPALLADFVKPLESTITLLSDAIDRLENQVIAGSDEVSDEGIVRVGRDVLCIRRFLAPMGDELSIVSLNPDELAGVIHTKHLRAAAEYVGRLVDSLDSTYNRVTLLLSLMRNREQERISFSMHKLTLVATVFLPLTFLTGLLGVNVAGIPEAHNPFAFWLLCAVLIAIALLAIVLIRWRRWM